MGSLLLICHYFFKAPTYLFWLGLGYIVPSFALAAQSFMSNQQLTFSAPVVGGLYLFGAWASAYTMALRKKASAHTLVAFILILITICLLVYYSFVDEQLWMRMLILNLSIATVESLVLVSIFKDDKQSDWLNKLVDYSYLFIVLYTFVRVIIIFFFLKNIEASMLVNSVWWLMMLAASIILSMWFAIVLLGTLVRDIILKLNDERSRDPLTHLLNRRGFYDAAKINLIDLPEKQYFLLMCDVDHFKKINDTHVKYEDTALVSAVELSAKFINDRFLPDKAIDVIDEAGAQRRLKAEQDDTLITVENIEDIISKIARIPPKTVSKDDKSVLEYLERDLKRVVFGQDEAITALASAIKLSRAGLKAPDKPVGSFVFAGPTGVGKTEVTKQLAKLLGVELVRFDMSEYMERHAVSRLIGAPPGYVGYDQGGLLTDAIHKNPHCVLLLDEIEKAHPDVFNLLLQVMDHGALTDNNGRKSDFRNVIIVLTTNIGAESISRNSIGFTEQDNSNDNQEAMKRAFAPEFRNRLDGVIQFKALPTTVIESVVDKFLTELQAQLDDKKVVLEVDQSARDWMAENGYDRLMGARPMQRLIQEHLKKPLAEMILFGELADHGGNVAVSVKKENGKAVGLTLEVFEDQTAEPA